MSDLAHWFVQFIVSDVVRHHHDDMVVRDPMATYYLVGVADICLRSQSSTQVEIVEILCSDWLRLSRYCVLIG